MNYENSKERYLLEQEKLALSNNQFKIGGKAMLDNLKDQEISIMIEEGVVTNNINRLLAAINLYKAVGGKDYTKQQNL